MLHHIGEQVGERKVLSQGEGDRRYWQLLGQRRRRQEIVLQHLLQVHALGGVEHEAVTDEALCKGVDFEGFGERKLASFNLLVSLFDFGGLEWGSSTQHCVEDDADGPVVDFIGVTILIFEHLRREIIRRSTNSLLALSLVVNLGSEAEISNLKLHALSQKEVAELKVPVDDFALVDVLHTFYELLDVVSGFELVEALASADQVRERLVVADVEHDVDVVLVFEVAIEAHDVLVGERAVDFDLTRQLLPCLGASQVLLAYHLECPGLILVLFSLDWRDSPNFVGLCEAALNRKKLSFGEELTLPRNRPRSYVMIWRGSSGAGFSGSCAADCYCEFFGGLTRSSIIYNKHI